MLTMQLCSKSPQILYLNKQSIACKIAGSEIASMVWQVWELFESDLSYRFIFGDIMALLRVNNQTPLLFIHRFMPTSQIGAALWGAAQRPDVCMGLKQGFNLYHVSDLKVHFEGLCICKFDSAGASVNRTLIGRP